jgi:hypothetical protein
MVAFTRSADALPPLFYRACHPRAQPLSAISDARQDAYIRRASGRSKPSSSTACQCITRGTCRRRSTACLVYRNRFPRIFQMNKEAAIKLVTW